MPLDIGGVANPTLGTGGAFDALGGAETVDVRHGSHIGAALQAAREARGLSLEDVAAITRVKASYLTALEELRLDALPSRPFIIGYIRAYAAALGMDGDAAVERFRFDDPVPDQPLRNPLGLPDDRDPRMTIVIAGLALVIAAIVLWNVAQRIMSEQAPPPPTAPAAAAAKAPLAVAKGPVTLGAPLPAPLESTTPEIYETPGLAAAAAAGGSADAAEAVAKAQAEQKPEPEVPVDLPPVFKPAGPVHGAAPEGSVVIVQARKAGSLIVRGADEAVYFARQLSAGEAYRVPAIGGLTLEVSDPKAFQVFVAGQSKGLMPAAQIAAGKLQE
jgi:cytoskeleton protein RodZ